MTRTRKIIRTTARVLSWVLISVFFLVVIALIFINTKPGKNVVRKQVLSYLRSTLNTRVEIGEIDYSLPKNLSLKNVYVEDQKKDTLLFGEELMVDLDMLDLLKGNTNIHEVSLKNIYANINRGYNDSVFNYQFIINAFTGNKSTTTNTDTAEMKLSLDRLLFKKVVLDFKDDFAGSDMKAVIQNLDLTTKKFSPDRLNFGIEKLVADTVKFSMITSDPNPKSLVKIDAPDTAVSSLYKLLINAGSVNIRHADVLIDNKVTGMYYANSIRSLKGTSALFDMNTYRGTVDSLSLDTSAIIFRTARLNPAQAVVTPVSDTSVAPSWYFAANHASIGMSDIRFDDVNATAKQGLDPMHMDVRRLDLKLNDFKFAKDSVTAALNNLAFIEQNSGLKLDTAHGRFSFNDKRLGADELFIKTPRSLIRRSFELRYDSLAAIQSDPANALLTAVIEGSTLSFDDLYILVPAIRQSLPPDQFAGLSVTFNTMARGNLKQLFIPSLELSGLTGSRLRARGTLYNLTDPKLFSYDLFVDNAVILKRDLVKFVPPENRKQFAELPEVINLRGRIKGTANDLAADVTAGGKDIAFSGVVNLKNISDPLNLGYDLNIRSATVSRGVISGFLPPELQQQIALPPSISASGKFKGDSNAFDADMRVSSSYGTLAVKGYMRNIKDPQRAAYDLLLTTPGFNAGALLKQDSLLGSVAGTFRAKGTGLDPKTMASDIAASVGSLEYNNYTYRNADIKAKLRSGVIESEGRIDDPSLKLNYDINANIRGQYPAFDGFVRVDTAQLGRLGFVKDTLNVSMTLTADAKSLVPRNLNALVVIDSLRMQRGTQRYQFDSTVLAATSANGIDSINITGPLADIKAGGAFDYDQVGTSIMNYIDGYYSIPNYEPTAVPRQQQLAFAGTVKQHPLIQSFVPGLVEYRDVTFSGTYNSADTDSAFRFNAAMPLIALTTARISAGNIAIDAKNQRLNYNIVFDTLQTAGNTLYQTTLRGGAANDSLSVTAITKDNAGTDWFGLSGTAAVSGETYSFRVQDTLILNYERWRAAPDNYIQYSPAGLVVNNFNISSDTASIAIRSRQLVPNSPLDIDINNFNLKSVSTIISKDTVFIAGIVDMKASVSDLNKALPGFTGNATVEDLRFMGYPLGNVTANASKVSDNNVSADIKLLGQGNDLEAKGNYYLNNTENQFDADLAVRQLSFRTLEAFSGGALERSQGNISGNIKLDGKFTEPKYNGTLNFDTVRFALAVTGTPYYIDKQRIELNYPRVVFPNFTVTDSLNHPMKIDGNIVSRSMMEYDLNVDVNANDFILVNARKKVNAQVYGFAAADINVGVTGSSATPNIEGEIILNNQTDLNLVLPQASYAKNDNSEIVRFIDRDTFDLYPPPVQFEPAKKPAAAFAQFLNYNLNIEVTKEAKLSILLDPSTGDQVSVQGDARLNAGVDPGGNLVLAGTYELDQGFYELHYQFLTRKFNLIKGSTITFSGEPLQAQANITAEYVANTSSRNLLQNEVTDVSPTLANSFSQQLPFRVILYITGSLAKPNINFDIQLPESNALLNNDLRSTIDAKLAQIRQDPAQVNKQVFSLLLFNRFVSEQSSDFFKGNGGDFNDLARQSVSQFLSSALNEIAADVFKGIDVNLNLNSYNDFTQGGNTERTDLNVTVSKTFANDRITVSVGSNFAVQGQDAAGKAGANNEGFKPDVSVSYKLSADGKYMIRGYTRNQFEVVLDGYVVETGVSFIVTLDYDKFSELFRKKVRKQ